MATAKEKKVKWKSQECRTSLTKHDVYDKQDKACNLWKKYKHRCPRMVKRITVCHI